MVNILMFAFSPVKTIFGDLFLFGGDNHCLPFETILVSD
jgi:hypothetical protein